jgi:hypothetical protein
MTMLFMLTPFIGLFLLIIGSVGLFVTNTSFSFGETLWIFGNLTYGTFTLIGLVIVICITVSGPELD